MITGSYYNNLYPGGKMMNCSSSYASTSSYNPYIHSCSYFPNSSYTLTASYMPMTSPKNNTFEDTTILHMFDNLFKSPNNTPNPKHPVSDTEKLQDVIELLNLKLLDSQETIDNLIKHNNNSLPDISLEMSRVTIDNLNRMLNDYKSHNNQLEANIVKMKNELGEVTAKNLSNENSVSILQKQLETSESNREHLSSHIKQQDAFLQDAKSLVQSLRNDVSTYKSNAEHLAQKAVKLQNDNVRLMEDNTIRKEDFAKLSTEMDFLQRDNDSKKSKIDNLQQSHTNLIKDREKLLAECRSYDCQRNVKSNFQSDAPFCGSCSSCLLKQSENIISNLSKEKSNLQNNLNFFQEVYHILHNALINIKESGIFSRPKDIAIKALRAEAISKNIHNT